MFSVKAVTLKTTFSRCAALLGDHLRRPAGSDGKRQLVVYQNVTAKAQATARAVTWDCHQSARYGAS
jgi:hypothetical protein